MERLILDVDSLLQSRDFRMQLGIVRVEPAQPHIEILQLGQHLRIGGILLHRGPEGPGTRSRIPRAADTQGQQHGADYELFSTCHQALPNSA